MERDFAHRVALLNSRTARIATDWRQADSHESASIAENGAVGDHEAIGEHSGGKPQTFPSS